MQRETNAWESGQGSQAKQTLAYTNSQCVCVWVGVFTCALKQQMQKRTPTIHPFINPHVSNASMLIQVTCWKLLRVHQCKPLQLLTPGHNVLLVDTLEPIFGLSILSSQMHPMPQATMPAPWAMESRFCTHLAMSWLVLVPKAISKAKVNTW